MGPWGKNRILFIRISDVYPIQATFLIFISLLLRRAFFLSLEWCWLDGASGKEELVAQG